VTSRILGDLADAEAGPEVLLEQETLPEPEDLPDSEPEGLLESYAESCAEPEGLADEKPEPEAVAEAHDILALPAPDRFSFNSKYIFIFLNFTSLNIVPAMFGEYSAALENWKVHSFLTVEGSEVITDSGLESALGSRMIVPSPLTMARLTCSDIS
jgi:hypothetical protein